MIDRITDAGQCDYYEVIIKAIKQGLSDNCLKQMRYRFTVNYSSVPVILGPRFKGEKLIARVL